MEMHEGGNDGSGEGPHKDGQKPSEEEKEKKEKKEQPLNLFGCDLDSLFDEILKIKHYTAYRPMLEGFPAVATPYRMLLLHLSLLRYSPHADPRLRDAPLTVTSGIDPTRTERLVSGLNSGRGLEADQVAEFVGNEDHGNFRMMWRDPCYQLFASKGPVVTSENGEMRCRFNGNMPVSLQVLRKALVHFKHDVERRKAIYMEKLEAALEAMKKSAIGYTIGSEAVQFVYEDFNSYLQSCMSTNLYLRTLNDVLCMAEDKLKITVERCGPHFVIRSLIRLYENLAYRQVVVLVRKTFFESLANLLFLAFDNCVSRKNVAKFLYQIDIQKVKVSADYLIDMEEFDLDSDAFRPLFLSEFPGMQTKVNSLSEFGKDYVVSVMKLIETSPKLTPESLLETTLVFTTCMSHFFTPAVAKSLSNTVYSRSFYIMQNLIARVEERADCFIPLMDDEDEGMMGKKSGGWLAPKEMPKFMSDVLLMVDEEIKEAITKGETVTQKYEEMRKAYNEWKKSVEEADAQKRKGFEAARIEFPK